jgi:DNA polymerase-3 subunit epsilon
MMSGIFDNHNLKIIVADVETTGFTPPVKIVEVAWTEIEEDCGYILDTQFSTITNPERLIEDGAAGVHGIRNSYIEEHKHELPVIEDIEWPNGPIFLVAHNVKFDEAILKDYMSIVGSMCTLILAKRLLPDAPDHKLSTLSCYCNLPQQLSHRAEGDVRDCVGVLDYMMEGTGWGFWKMYDYYLKPVFVTTMPWGKHKGKNMLEVPKSYLVWAYQQELDKDMRYTLDIMLKRGDFSL